MVVIFSEDLFERALLLRQETVMFLPRLQSLGPLPYYFPTIELTSTTPDISFARAKGSVKEDRADNLC